MIKFNDDFKNKSKQNYFSKESVKEDLGDPHQNTVSAYV